MAVGPMNWYLIAGIAIVVLMIICFTAATTVMILASRRGKGDDAEALPADALLCGACGYPVLGAKTLTCPECGADLTRVGIVRPSKHRTPIIALLAIGAALGVFMLLGLGWAAFFAMQTTNQQITVQHTQQLQQQVQQPEIKEAITFTQDYAEYAQLMIADINGGLTQEQEKRLNELEASMQKYADDQRKKANLGPWGSLYGPTTPPDPNATQQNQPNQNAQP